jgi:hypothetical protein
VRTAEHLLKIRDLDARVAFGGRERRVPEQLLDVADVGTALEQMRRRTVPVMPRAA